MMKRVITISLLIGFTLHIAAQQMLTLDSCRNMALRNNKQINIAKLKLKVAQDTKKAARTKYLPHIDIMGGYEFMSKEISILNNEQKSMLGNLGSAASGHLGNTASTIISEMAANGLITPQAAEAFGKILNNSLPGLQQTGNSIGQSISDAFKTDTKNMFAASIMLTQPIFMGGKIVAANKIADLNESLNADALNNQMQNIAFNIDNTYWTVVSLKHKETLATSYLELVKRLREDVQKMIKEGVATKADGLKVDVKVNEAEMQLTQVENGLSLSKMLLCQLCGIQISKDIVLADEANENISSSEYIYTADAESAKENRLELRMLNKALEISKQKTNIVRSEYLPQIALTAGYTVTNPNVYNGFERKSSGVWNVGVLVKMPVWNWFESKYKIRANKTAASIAQLELEEAQEKIELQVNQGSFKVSEANKRLTMAEKNTEEAEENLRCANVGFKEGVMDVTDVMAAQTAWLQAKSQKIDAEIDVKLSQINMKKVLGDFLF